MSRPSDQAAAVPTPQSVRLDKWLWATRLYRSRSLATQACHAGHVKIGGQSVKPSHAVRLGEVVVARTGRMERTVKVLALLERRVGAKLVPHYLEELTPPEEYDRARRPQEPPLLQYHKGWGRPTKKQRRQLERFLDQADGA